MITGELIEKSEKYCECFESLCGAECVVFDVGEIKTLFQCPNGTGFCDGCSHCQAQYSYLYGCHEAYRWNGKYIYYCPAGLVFIASPLSDITGELTGGMVVGPIVMGEPQDTLSELPQDLHKSIQALPVFSTRKTNHIAETLSLITSSISGLPHSRMGNFVYEQEQLLKDIYSVRERSLSEARNPYPIEDEKKLQAMIRNRDKAGSQKMINQLLSHIFLASDFELDEIKARVIELVVLLSRATIDAGADINEIFRFSQNYFHDIEQFHSIEELGVWLTGIMHRFINYSFDFRQIKHADSVYKVMEYVRDNFDKKLTLDEIARNVYLSRSYLSRVFKEETGQNLSAYINFVRIDKSKIMLMDSNVNLADIANLCGFEDQSYFIRVFKKLVGVSPKKYRDSRGHI